jgi:hypothetical protein
MYTSTYGYVRNLDDVDGTMFTTEAMGNKNH